MKDLIYSQILIYQINLKYLVLFNQYYESNLKI